MELNIKQYLTGWGPKQFDEIMGGGDNFGHYKAKGNFLSLTKVHNIFQPPAPPAK